MGEGMEEWLTESNEAVSLQLVRALEDSDALQDEELQITEPFQPQFTYPIFGEQERIFGYKGLDVKLSFASGSLRQLLDITYEQKLESEATPADDLEAILYNFIPADYTKSTTVFQNLVDTEAESFKPLGEKLGSYIRPSAAFISTNGGAKGKGKSKGKGKGKANGQGIATLDVQLDEANEDAVVFEMYKTTWDTPGFREYHRRMQLFILLYIEGGSYVHEDEDAWEFITLFERRERPQTDLYTYHFVGYTSVYPFWCYPDQVRLRLSQFVILPPYQEQGHGSKLYSTLYQHVLSRPEVAELTVEDPAEAFEDLRDRNDLRYLVSQGLVEDAKFLEDVGATKRGPRAKWEMEVRKKHKIAQRQFDRLMEMLLLKQLNMKDQVKVKAYRIQVKARLYRFNYEMLSQMTPEERKEALSKTYDSVIEDYQRILRMTFG